MKTIQVSNAAWQRLKIVSLESAEREGRAVPLHELIDRLVGIPASGLGPVEPFTVVRVPNAVTALMEGSDLASGDVLTMGGSSEVERGPVTPVVAGSIPAPSAKTDRTRKAGRKKRPARKTSAARARVPKATADNSYVSEVVPRCTCGHLQSVHTEDVGRCGVAACICRKFVADTEPSGAIF